MYYISVGQGNGMYTLREEYVVKTNYGLDVKHNYIRNLSRDWSKAITKAKEIVGDSDLFVGDESHLNEWGDADKYHFQRTDKYLYEKHVLKEEVKLMEKKTPYS